MDALKKPVVNVTGANLHFSEDVPSLKPYLKDVRKYEPITIEEERKLFERIKAGDESAKNELVKAHQRFVLAVAKRFSVGDNIMDLVQVGNIGMLQAIDKFDLNKNGEDGKPIRFLSYAAWYIRREISFYLVNNSLIRKTNNIKTVFKINKVKNNFFLENGRYPSVNELTDIIDKEYGIKIKDPSYLYDIETKYLNTVFDEDNKRDTFEKSWTFNEKSAEVNEYVGEAEKEHNKYIANKLLEHLSPREQTVLKRIYGIGCDKEYTIDEIAKELNLTRERVRQIKISSENKLKKLAKAATA